MQRRPKRARYGGRVVITYCGPRGTFNHKVNENCGAEKALAHFGFVLRKIDLESQTFEAAITRSKIPEACRERSWVI